MSVAGQLRSRLVLEAPVEAPNGQGGFIRTYQPVATIWASLEARAHREVMAGDALRRSISHRIRMRPGADLSVRHRFRLGERLFLIHAFSESRITALIEIDAEEVSD